MKDQALTKFDSHMYLAEVEQKLRAQIQVLGGEQTDDSAHKIAAIQSAKDAVEKTKVQSSKELSWIDPVTDETKKVTKVLTLTVDEFKQIVDQKLKALINVQLAVLASQDCSE